MSLFNLDMACAAASQALAEGLCKGGQGQMTVMGFPYLCYPYAFVFSHLENTGDFLGAYGSAEKLNL